MYEKMPLTLPVSDLSELVTMEEKKTSISQDMLTVYSAAYSGRDVLFNERICGHLGQYQSIIFTEEGMEAMASTQGAGYITHINRALDEYWDK